MLKTRIALATCLLSCFACAVKPATRPDGEATLRASAAGELAEAQRLLQSHDPHVDTALQHLANAEAILELPRDARLAAEVHVWTGMAHMQAGRPDRAREHFQIARGLFQSIGAKADAEAVEHLLRR